MHTWLLQEAKHKLNQVVDHAQHNGPQIIVEQGTEVAVVLSAEEYHKLVASRQKLSDFFQASPLVDADLDLSRDRSPAQRNSEL